MDITRRNELLQLDKDPLDIKKELPDQLYDETEHEGVVEKGEIAQNDLYPLQLPNVKTEPPEYSVFKEVAIEFEVKEKNTQSIENIISDVSLKECRIEIVRLSPAELKKYGVKLQMDRYVCDLCNFTCMHLSTLRCHKLIHTGDKPFRCDQCSYTCQHFSGMKTHKLVHVTTKLFKCDQCDYTTNYPCNLKAHGLTHFGDKRFRCDLCSYTSNYASNLKTHKLLHTDSKPFKCDQCSYTCHRSGNLRRHSIIHTGEKLYKCDRCYFTSNKKGILIKHKKDHIGENPLKITNIIKPSKRLKSIPYK